MLTEFWTGLGGRLADRWLAALFSPAFALWLAAGATWLGTHQPRVVRTRGWHAGLRAWGHDLDRLPALAQLGYLLLPLLAVVLSGLLLRALTLPVLRLLEGYWPAALDGLADRRRGRLSARVRRDTDTVRALAGRDPHALTHRERARYRRADRRRRQAPADPGAHMPTRLGNALRTAETRPWERYGLDPVVCWPRLWLLLPDQTREGLDTARASLSLGTQTWMCGLAYTALTPWAWWALPAGLAVAVAAYGSLLRTAGTYGTLVESCFDLHRHQLYRALRWPLPANPAEEKRTGARLTNYLLAGSHADQPTFTA